MKIHSIVIKKIIFMMIFIFFIIFVYPGFDIIGKMPAQDERSKINKLPEIPFRLNSKEPFISARVVAYNHIIHQNGYVINLNKMLIYTYMDITDIETKIEKTYGPGINIAVVNEGNHEWNKKSYRNFPGRKGEFRPKLNSKENAEGLGFYSICSENFIDTAANPFGSARVWLFLEGNKIKIMAATNTDSPIAIGKKAKTAIVVWEYTFYPDFKGSRKKIVETSVERMTAKDFTNQIL